jgi:hypothetical protein
MADHRPSRVKDKGPWEVISSREFNAWFRGLDAERASQAAAGLRRIGAAGPTLGRPRVDSIKGSRVHNLKELRLRNGGRVLFAFDPNRRAIALVGGDKTGSWNRWYRKKIPLAERVYFDHLRTFAKGDRCPSQREAGQKSAARGR